VKGSGSLKARVWGTCFVGQTASDRPEGDCLRDGVGGIDGAVPAKKTRLRKKGYRLPARKKRKTRKTPTGLRTSMLHCRRRDRRKETRRLWKKKKKRRCSIWTRGALEQTGDDDAARTCDAPRGTAKGGWTNHLPRGRAPSAMAGHTPDVRL